MHLYRLIMLDGFNVPKYDWLNDTPLCKCYYYNKIKFDLCYLLLTWSQLAQKFFQIMHFCMLYLQTLMIYISISNYHTVTFDY
jgi:hypothetical protein